MAKNNVIGPDELFYGLSILVAAGIGYSVCWTALGGINTGRLDNAIRLMNDGDYQSAYDILKDLDSGDENILVNSAICLYRLDEYDKQVEKLCLQALAKNKASVYGNFMYGCYLQSDKQFIKSLLYFKRTDPRKLVDNHDRAYFYYMQGLVFRGLQDNPSLKETIAKLNTMKNSSAQDYAEMLREND